MSTGKQESPHTTVLVATAHNTQGISKRYIERLLVKNVLNTYLQVILPFY